LWRWGSGGAVLADLARLAWLSVKERAGRAALAAFGVFIAFLALSVALSIGEMVKQSVEQFFQQLGLNTVWVTAGPVPFTDADVARASAALGGRALVVPISSEWGRLRLPDDSEVGVSVYYVPPEYVELLVPREAMRSGQRYVGGSLVLVNHNIRMVGNRTLEPGTPVIFVRDDGDAAKNFVVAGTFEPSMGIIGEVLADAALVARREYSMLYIVTESPQAAERAVERLRPYFPGADIFSPQTLARQVGEFVSTVQLGLGALAGVSTLVTAMWLYDTMTISVLQRTKEIGIMRAVGYKRRHIVAMLILEALIIVGVGIAAALPVLAAMSMVKIPLGRDMYLNLFVTPGVVLVSAALVVAVNILGVLAPAYRAGRLNIVDALRYDIV
jgi:putative ABC transport system permease protein